MKYSILYRDTANDAGIPGHLPASTWLTLETVPLPFRGKIATLQDSAWDALQAELNRWIEANRDPAAVALEAKISAAVEPVTAQFAVVAVAFEERQKRLDELLQKPDIEGLTKAVTILLGDTAQMTKLLLSFQSQFEEMARASVDTVASVKP
jgi:site-specific recombinase